MPLALRLGLAAAVVVVLAGCGGSSAGVPRGFVPEGATAVGEHDIWILGYRGRRGYALVRSTDAGRHFERVQFPIFPYHGAGPSVTFADPRDGFAYVLFGSSPLYATHDGGRSWHPALRDDVIDFAVGGGNAYAFTRRGLERSLVSRDAWRLALRLRTQYAVGLAARGSQVWLLGPPRTPGDRDTIRISSDHGRTFATRPGPCFRELGGRLVPAGGGVVWAVCPTGMMAGLRRSTDGGRTFAVASFHDPGGLRLPAMTNGGQVFPLSPRTAILSGGGGGPLLRTTDGGGHWTKMRLLFRIVQLWWLGFTSPHNGFALVQTHGKPNEAPAELWGTTDGGATWREVPIR